MATLVNAKGLLHIRGAPGFNPHAGVKIRIAGHGHGGDLVSGSGRDDVEGDAPCLRIRGPNSMRFRLAVDAGDRSVTLSVKQPLSAQPRPQLVVHANPDIGLLASVSGTAPAGDGWVTLGPVAFTATSAGGVWVELVNPANNYDAFYDDVAIA